MMKEIYDSRGEDGRCPIGPCAETCSCVCSQPACHQAESSHETQERARAVSLAVDELPGGLFPVIMASIQGDAPAEYAVWTQDGRYQAHNPDHELQASFAREGVEIQSNHPGAPSWGMEFVGWGYGTDIQPVGRTDPQAIGNRIEYRYGSLTEWYLNGPLGLEQGFTLQAPPLSSQKGKALKIELALKGDVVPVKLEAGVGVELYGAHEEYLMRYGHLYVYDAVGRSLPVHAELTRSDDGQRVSIVVDDRHAVYPITVDPLIQQQTKLVASDKAANDIFGYAVAMSGNTAVIGSQSADLPGKADAGAVYVFVRSGSTWTQQAKLTASDSAASDRFGNAVSISGDTIVVGAPYANVGAIADAGAAYVFVRNGTLWSQQAKLTASDGAASDIFGNNVVVQGETVFVGAPYVNAGANANVGAVYQFERDGITWTQRAKLTASDGAANDQFGSGLAINGDTLIVGAPDDATLGVGAGNGAVYVFVRSGSTWTEQAKLTASDGAAGDEFGAGISISGDTVLVAARLATVVGSADAGAAYVFVRNGTTWTQQAKLTASDKAANDQFGSWATVNGDTALIGSYRADLPAKADAGAAYVFVRNGTTWTQQAKLTASDSAAGDLFGASAFLGDDIALIGARYANDGAVSDCGAVYVFQISPDAPTNTGSPSEPFAWGGEVFKDNAIGLRTGEKMEVATDLSVNTPAGPLAFTRTYRQNKRATYQFMGMGWTHEHALSLTKIVGTPNKVVVQMPNGGELNLNETSAGSNHYEADPGSGAVVDYNTISTQYTLTGSDKSTYVFDSTGKLLSRSWPSGEVWTYAYSSGKLSEVADQGYDLDPGAPTVYRKLQFTYISNPGQYNDGQLWRVGDQNATGLSGGSPAGRYVEFTYTPQKSNGVTIGSPKALLNTVRDVLGNVWTYKYYGQVAGQSDANQLDFLIEVLSPSVDTTGDGTADGTLSLEQLLYTTSGATITNITQNEGDSALSTAFAFQPSGQNITTETQAGKVTTHSFNNGVYASQQDPAGNVASQAVNLQYRPNAVKDEKGNATEMVWGAGGKLLQQVKDALGNLTTLNYNGSGSSEDTLNYSINAEGRKTQYTYGDVNNPRLPTRIQIYDTDGTTILRWQEFTYDTRGRVLTDKLFDPSGTVVQKQTNRAYYTSGNGNGLLQTLTQVDVPSQLNNVVTTYFYDAVGRVVKVSQNSMFGTCQITYTVYDQAGRVVASICSYDPGVSPDPTTAAEAVALYNPAFPDKNRVTTYEYDTLGRQVKTVVDAGASYAETALTVYDSLSRVVRTIRNYVASASITNPYVRARDDFDHGINNDQNLITEMVYNERGLVRKEIDVLGNVKLLGYDDAGRLVRTVDNASQPNYNNTYGTGGDPSLSWYKSLVANDEPDEDIITVREYDAAGNLVKTTDAIGNVTLTVYDALNRPVKVVQNASQPNYNRLIDPTLKDYVPSSAADQDLIDLTEYDAMGRVSRRQDEMGNWTLLVYDGLGRLSKTIRNASRPTYNRVIDPTFKNYVVSANPDQDFITERVYDLAERELYTVDELGRRDWTAYDGLGRQAKTINNALGGATDGGVNDPRSDAYKANVSLFDQDQVSLIHYDSSGRVWRTRDNLGNWTLFGFDTLNRQVKVIRNASNFSYNAASDTPLERYVPAVGAADDQDVITQTIYNGQGQVAVRIDELGNETRFTYDRLERPIKTVENFVTGVFNPARPDQDRVSLTSYDIASRVIATVDARGTQTTFAYDKADRRRLVTRAANTSLATKSYTCYDKAGRVLRQIANWIDDPIQPSPDARDGQGNWLFAPVAHGTANDQNLITTFSLDRLGRPTAISNPVGNSSAMTYDKDGQQESMTDPLGVVTKYRYDRARRRTLTVESFQANGEDPALWKWNGSAWTKSDGSTAIAFGTDKDQNLITQVEYDKAGRRTAMRDPRGNRTTYSYDQLDRRTALTDPRGSVWATAYTHLAAGTVRMTLTDPNNNLTQQDMDRLGRVVNLKYLNESPKLTPDITFVYDKAGNRLSMVENDGAATVRKTNFAYDRADRLVQASFDRAGDGTDVQVVGYEYDAGGLRTKLTLPGSLSVVYTYNTRGQLVSLTDWDSQATQFAYDAVDRLATADRANDLLSSYQYDPAGRLALARHTQPGAGSTSFPSASALDNFNRANGAIGANWSGTTGGYSIASNQIDVGTGGDIYWAGAAFGANQEVAVTLAVIDAASDEIDLLLKVQNAYWGNGLIEVFYKPSTSIVQVVTYTSSQGWVQRGSDISVSFAAGDQFGARALADGTVEVYKNGTLVGSRDVSAWPHYAKGGSIGLWLINSGGTILDDFVGGAFVSAAPTRVLGHFAYTIDARGNRTQVYQGVPRTTTGATALAYNDPAMYYYQGTWSDANPFKESTSTNAALRAAFLGTQITLTMGKGSDHGIYDLYLDGALQHTQDGYAASAGEQTLILSFADEGPHTLEVRSTGTKNASSSGFKLRFKTLATPASARLYDLQTMAYAYDAAVRLKNASTYPGVNTAATPTKSYAYGYDVAGNRTQQVVTPGGTTNYAYDAANRLTSDGVNSYTYDNAGRMTGDGVNTYAWDRANRLLSQAGVSNLYNGLGQRVQQTVGATVTKYVLDVQPALFEVLAATTGANTTRYLHGLRGLHAQEDNAGNWTWPVEDGLGSVVGVVNNSLAPQESRQYAPYGEATQVSGSSQTVYGFTGEPTDGGVGLVYLRARYLHPALAQFISLDTLETPNRYAYADDDPINRVDPSGLFGFCDRPGNCGRSAASSGNRSGDLTSRPSASSGSRPGPRPGTSGGSGSRPAARPSASGSSGGRPGPRPNGGGASGGRPGSRPASHGGSAASVAKGGNTKPGQRSTNDKTTESRTTVAKGKPQKGTKPVARPPQPRPEPIDFLGDAIVGNPNPNLSSLGGGYFTVHNCLFGTWDMVAGACILPGQNPTNDEVIITVPPLLWGDSSTLGVGIGKTKKQCDEEWLSCDEDCYKKYAPDWKAVDHCQVLCIVDWAVCMEGVTK